MYKIESFKNQAWNVKKVHQKERMDVNDHKTAYSTIEQILKILGYVLVILFTSYLPLLIKHERKSIFCCYINNSLHA
jgi:hypothetical protein